MKAAQCGKKRTAKPLLGKKESAMEEKKLPFTGREKIRFNVPPFTGREYEYVRQAVENQKICGDGEFTKKASHWFEEKTGTAKCLMTTSCTHATELAAILADIKPGMKLLCRLTHLFPRQMRLCCGAACLFLWIFVRIP